MSHLSFGESSPASLVHRSESSSASSRLARWLGWITDASLFCIIFFVPLIFYTGSLDVLELSKQSFLGFLVGIALVAWLGQAIVQKRFVISRHWLHLAVLIFTLGYTFVSFFSLHRYVSWVGFFGYSAWSVGTMIACALFYFLCVHRFKTIGRLYDALFVYVAASGVAAFLGLLQIFQIYLFSSSATHASAFTTVGSVFSLAMFLSASVVVSSILIFHGCQDDACIVGRASRFGQLARFLVILTLLASLAFLAVVDFSPAWISVALGTLLALGLGWWRSRSFGRPSKLVIPGFVALMALLFLVLPTPFHADLPSEVAPSVRASWDVARQTLQAHPLFGSGPATWIYDYAKYRAMEVNASPFWTVRFDRALSSFFTLLTTTGLVGMGLWVLLLLSVFAKTASHLVGERRDDRWYPYLLVFSGWFCLMLVSFLYNFSTSHQIVFWLFLGLLGGLVADKSFVFEARRRGSFGVVMSASVLLAVLTLVLMWLTGQRFIADIRFSSAVKAFNSSQLSDQVIENMEKAHRLNPYSDLYLRNLSRVHFMRVMSAIAAKPTADQASAIQAEAALAIELSTQAEMLAPANVDNSTNVAFLYQNFAPFTQGLDVLAIKNYQAASLLEPTNPTFPAEIGRLYLTRADASRQALAGVKDAKNRTNLMQQIQSDDRAALTFIRQAITLKSDYLPARYYLGSWYERQGKVKEALSELEQVLNTNNHDVGVAFELALLYYRNGDKDKAVNLLEQIVSFDPVNANARWYLASMYEESGRIDKAILMLGVLKVQLPDNQVVMQKLEALKKASALKSPTGVLPEPIQEEVKNSAEAAKR